MDERADLPGITIWVDELRATLLRAVDDGDGTRVVPWMVDGKRGRAFGESRIPDIGTHQIGAATAQVKNDIRRAYIDLLAS